MHIGTFEERIRAKAYELWQEDGSMEGCADEYWRRARSIVEAELTGEQRLREGTDGERDGSEKGSAADER